MYESEKVIAQAVRKLVADAVQHWHGRTRQDAPSVLPREFKGRPAYLLFSDRRQPARAGQSEDRMRDGARWRLEWTADGTAVSVVHPSAGAEWEIAHKLTLAALEEDPDKLGGFVYEGVRRRLAELHETERRHGLKGDYQGARQAAKRLDMLFGEPPPLPLAGPRLPWASDDEDLSDVDTVEAGYVLRGPLPSKYGPAESDPQQGEDNAAFARAVERLPDAPGKPLRSMVRELLAGGWDALKRKSAPLLKPFAAARGYTDRTARAWYDEAFDRLEKALCDVPATAVGESRWPRSEAWRGSKRARPVVDFRTAFDELADMSTYRVRDNFEGAWHVWGREHAAELEGWDPLTRGMPRGRRVAVWRSRADHGRADAPLAEQSARGDRRWLLQPEAWETPCRGVAGIGAGGAPDDEIAAYLERVPTYAPVRPDRSGGGTTLGDWTERQRPWLERQREAARRGEIKIYPLPEMVLCRHGVS